MSIATYSYPTYVRASADQVWSALTDADLTARYWGHANVSDWRPGSRWQHVRTDGSGVADVVGRVLAAEPPTRLVITFGEPSTDDGAATEPSVVTFLVEPYRDIVRLTVTHEKLPDAQALRDVAHGWPAVLSNLKTLLETGEALPQRPWETAPAEAP
ncbi:uncharacterized protein YndB with AHSA1/START domain [Streptacidiphilus sp. MAP12-33]|uniref:SRPBCC family protein n=1 Tax=Streptacidiphilus sp. MAP12-33 TaxID=3156266 RepID=UPI0035161A7A